MNIKENSIIICNQNTKKRILEKNFHQKKLFNATFYSLEEFKNKICFKITDEAVFFAAKFLNISYENAKVIVPNLYYVDCHEEYLDKKLIELQMLKNKLIDNKLLEFDLLFKEFIKGKDIYLIDLLLDNFYTEMFDGLKNEANLYFFNTEVSNKKYSVVNFENYNMEVDYVFGEISKLLRSGVDINNILILSESNEYRHLINRYSKLYKIDVFLKENESIKNHSIVKDFLSHLRSGLSKEEALTKISRFNNEYILNKLVGLLNRFYFLNDNIELIEVLETELKNIYYEDKKVSNCIKVVDLSYSFNDNEYVFLIGFNNNSIPKTYIDDSYLGDKYSVILPITLSVEKNILERNKAIYLLSKIKKLHISFSKHTQTENLISVLSDYIDFDLINGVTTYGLSMDLDRLKLGSMIDDLINFNIHNEFLDVLFSTFEKTYKTYDNRFKSIDKELLKKKIDSYIRLSYSSISTYYKCQFYYYLERVLKIKHNQENKATTLGSMFHAILEKYGTDGFDLETEKNKQLEGVEDLSIRFYFDKLWPDFLIAFEMIDLFKSKTYLNEELHEQEVNVDYSNDEYTMIFNGKIDKIIFKQIDGIDYVSVIDYKTGTSDKASLNNVSHGFNLQLPVYAFFLVKSTLFKSPKVLGLFLQKVLNNCKPTKTKSVEVVKKEALKFEGYSIVDRGELSLLDPTYKKSEFIKSMSITKEDVFGKFAKVYSENDILNLIETVEQLIVEAFDNITEASFEINPKEINGENQSCQYCPFANICYKTNKDIKVLEEKKFVETIEECE